MILRTEIPTTKKEILWTDLVMSLGKNLSTVKGQGKYGRTVFVTLDKAVGPDWGHTCQACFRQCFNLCFEHNVCSAKFMFCCTFN